MGMIGCMNLIFWILFVITSLIGVIQLFGYYGSGSSSKKIEYISFVIILVLFITVKLKFGWSALLLFVVSFLVINTTIGKYFAQFIHLKFIGYIPRIRRERSKDLFENRMSTSEVGNSINHIEIEKEALEYSKKIRLF